MKKVAMESLELKMSSLNLKAISNTHANANLIARLVDREIQEGMDGASYTSEVLQKLGVDFQNLPQNCKLLIEETAQLKKLFQLKTLNPAAISLCYSETLLDNMKQDYEILKLTEKNRELDRVIKHNSEKLESLKKQLVEAKKSINNQKLETIEEEMRVLNQKYAAYAKTYQKHKDKWESLRVESDLRPESVQGLVQQLAELRAQELALKQNAEDVTLTREASALLLNRTKH